MNTDIYLGSRTRAMPAPLPREALSITTPTRFRLISPNYRPGSMVQSEGNNSPRLTTGVAIVCYLTRPFFNHSGPGPQDSAQLLPLQ